MSLEGQQLMYQQVIKPVEILTSLPYEALPESELRNLLNTLTRLKPELRNVSPESIPFWDAYVALSYHALYMHRLHIAEKNDRALENSICDVAKMLLDYCIDRLKKSVDSSFLTLSDNLKLIAAIYNLNSPYGKNEIQSMFRQLVQAPVPAVIKPADKTETEQEEDKKETKKSVHTVPPVPVVNVKNLISPVVFNSHELSDVSGSSASPRPSTSKFSERYSKKMYWHFCEIKIGDRLLDILKDLSAFSSFMETDISAINFYKAVITRLSDAKQLVGKVDIMSSELDVALHMSKVSLPDCCSPDKLEAVCSFGISCIANTCKLLTSLNVIDSQAALDDADGNLLRLLSECRLSIMKKTECLMTVYEQLEKSVLINNREAARNMGVIATRYFLASIEAMLPTVADAEPQSPLKTPCPLGLPALYLVRHLLLFLYKLTDDLKNFEVPSMEGLSTTWSGQVVLSGTYTPWSRMIYLMRQHDVFGVLLKTLSICHVQAFSRLLSSKADNPSSPERIEPSPQWVKSQKSKHRERDAEDAPPRAAVRAKLSVSQDDLILGCLWEELNAEPVVATDAAPVTTPATQDASLTESLIDTCSKILTFLDREFFQSEHNMAEILVKEFLAANHLCHILPMLTSSSFEYVPSGDLEPPHLRSCMTKYEMNLDLFLHNLVTTGFVSDDIIISVLKSAGLDLSSAKKNDPWPLYLPKIFLSFFGRVLLKWQFDQQDDLHESPRHATLSSTATLTIWSRVCIALQQRALKDDQESSSLSPNLWKNYLDFEDLNPENLYLLLMAFHGLALMQKKAVLTQLASAFVSCACKIKDWNERNLLLISRILVTIEYLMHRLYEPAEALLSQVESLLFPAASKGKTTSDTPLPAYELAQKVFEFSPPGQVKRHGLFRVFYYVIHPDSYHQDPLTLDGLACSFILAPNKFPEYADFYHALSSLFNQLHMVNLLEHEDLRRIATFNYAALLTWRLLRILPPSLAHWDILRKDGQEFPLESVQNVTAALWITRLSNKSYKTWLKDTFVKLGLTPLNADLMLSNCVDAVGLSKDVNRLKHFMEAFLIRRKELKRKRDDVRVSDTLLAIDASPTEEVNKPDVFELGMRNCFYDGCFVDDKEFPEVPLSLSFVSLVCKTQQAFDEVAGGATGENTRLVSAATVLTPSVVDCIIQYGQFCVSGVMNRVNERLKGGHNTFEIYRRLAFVCGQPGSSLLASTNHIAEAVPPLLNDVLIEWQMKETGILPVFQSWKKEHSHGEPMTYDSFINSVVTNHMVGTTNLKMGNASGRNLSLKYTLHMLISFLNELKQSLPVPCDVNMKDHICKALLPVVMGCFGTDSAELATEILEHVLGNAAFEVHYMKTIMCYAYDILKLIRGDDVSADVDPTNLASKCVETLNALLDTPAGRTALSQVFAEKAFDITEIILSVTKSKFSSAFDIMVLNFVNRILVEIVKNHEDTTMTLLSQSFKRLEQRSPDALRAWMDKVLRHTSWKDAGERKCVMFLENWVNFIQVTDRSLSEMLSEVLLKSLTAIVTPTMGSSGSDYPPFADLMPNMEVLASSCKMGHELLLTSSAAWIKSCIQYLSQREVVEKLNDGVTGGSLDQMLSAVSSLVSYVGRILSALRNDSKRTASPDPDDLDLESNTLEDNDDDEESVQGDDSDDEVDDSKLCTFTVTAKEFMSQHWYHCHTCGLTNGQGMCSVCAKVCHKGHDVTYSKFGSFFCDCGARDDGSCQALRKRGGVAGVESSNILMGNRAVAAFSSPSLGSTKTTTTDNTDVKRTKEMNELNLQLQQQLDSQRDVLTRLLTGLDIVSVLMSLMDHINNGANGVIRSLCSSSGRSEKISQRLKALHTVALPSGGKAILEPNERLLQPLVATQEGTFDNVKGNHPGEIPEPTSSRAASQQNAIRRRVMVVFTHGPAKYLAMAVEKSKISVYQLSHLLKQVCDRHQLPVNSGAQSGGTTKLMLPCHGNVTFMFTVSSVVVNPLREGLFAVTGTKDCVAVLMNPESGTHEVLPVTVGPIDSSNFIIKAFWMPDSQTELLVATLDFIKIYDLAKSTERPVFDLLIANGKIRDVTIAFLGHVPHVLAMSSTGQVFIQELTPVAAADMGPFFVTGTLNLANSDLPRVGSRDEDDAVAGVALYYSHAFQLLFLSYGQGKLFVAPLTSASGDNSVVPATLLTFSKLKGDLTQGKSLWCFSENGGYPGQIFAWLQGISVPIVIVIDSEGISFQIVKPSSSKVKALDMVVTKYASADGPHAILASVNDDGTLKFFSLNSESTSAWLPAADLAGIRGGSPKPSKIIGSITKMKEVPPNLTFPVDFFEDCQVLGNIVLSGDLVDCYSKSKLKSRLEQNSAYIVSEKTGGFTIDIANYDHTNVICGFRVGLGSQGIDKVPAFVKVLGRTKPFVMQRPRHFDFPLTEEESVLADGKVSLFFAACENGAMTYLDSLVVYGKSKASLGWDDEGEKASTNVDTGSPPLLSTRSGAIVTLIDTVTGRTLKAMELAISIWPFEDIDIRQKVIDKTIGIISGCQMLPQTCQNAKCLLFALHDFQRSFFHSSKDAAIVAHAVHALEEIISKMKPANEEGSKDLVDSCTFFQIVASLRPIAAKRPANLHQQLLDTVDETKLELVKGAEPSLRKPVRSEPRMQLVKTTSFLESLSYIFWHIHASQPKKTTVANVVQLQEYLPLETTIQSLIEIIHAVMIADAEMIPLGVKLYTNFICAKDQAVALPAKGAVLKTLRPTDSVINGSQTGSQKATRTSEKQSHRERSDEPASAAPLLPDLEEGNDSENEADESFPAQEDDRNRDANQNVEDMLGELQMVWQMVEPHLGGGQLDDFIENPNNLQQILDIPPDADDESMLDLAMALNMQPDEAAHENASSVGVASIQPQVGEESSDSNTDADGASDDEASNAATETSAVRPHSPTEQLGSNQGSDEGSGVSSLAGDPSRTTTQTTEASRSEAVSSGATASDSLSPNHPDVIRRKLRRAVIDRLQSTVPTLSEGVLSIPTMQILFNLCTDLDPRKYEEDRVLIDRVIHTVVGSLGIDREDKQNFARRSPENEVIILLLRFLSVIISKSASRYRKYRPNQPIPSSFTNHCASVLNGTKVLDFCHYLLKLLLDKNKVDSEVARKRQSDEKLLKPKLLTTPPDMAPFFLKPFVKSCGHDLFQDYPTLLTEMALRLPYQMKKVGDSEHLVPAPNFEATWCYTLCEYMSFGPSHIDRRPPRKLLMALCGSKDKYRQVRDLHAFDFHIKEVKKVCGYRGGGSFLEKVVADLDYDHQTVVVEHLKACLEIAATRTINWQRHCQKERTTLVFLVRLAISLDEPVATTILHLLLALFGMKDKPPTVVAIEEGPVVKAVVTLLNQNLEASLLRKFIRCFLLQSNSGSMRSLVHHFLFAYYRNSDAKYQDILIRIMWKLFEELPTCGHKATEFVDLLGFLTVKNPYLGEADWRTIIIAVIDMLKSQNQVMNSHPNARIYQQLSDITGLEGYYLESDPCLVCNCPDSPTQVVKLSAIKADAKYTSSSQLYKLSGAFSIDRIVLKITELKRVKMVKTLNIYYSNVAVDNIVELKNNMAAWKKAKSVSVAPGQAEVKADFMLPIQATNLMIEHAEFYDNPQMTQETLQCPRCSTMVAAHPGICGNCGENVFQCLKCRSINYENREPFLCHSCGFCKYGKFDYNVHCRPSSSGNLDPVLDEEQRLRTINIVDQLLTKCDSQYRTLQLHRSAIETMLLALQKNERDILVGGKTENPVGAAGPPLTLPANALSNTANVNPAIQAIAYRYSVECKSVVQSMVQHIQKIMTCRKLLKVYDRKLQVRSIPGTAEIQAATPFVFSAVGKSRTASCCYGCAAAASQFCVRLLRVIAKIKNQHYFNAYPGLVNELIENHLHRGNHELRLEVKRLINSLMQGSQTSAVEFITLLQERIASIQKFCTLNPSIAASVGNEITLLEMDSDHLENDRHWEIKLRCVVRLFLNAVQSGVPGVLECIALPCLKIILNTLKGDVKGQKVESLSTLQLPQSDNLVKVVRWLKGDARNSFQAWASRCPKKLSPSSNAKEVRDLYLQQKFGLRWRDKIRHATESDKLHFGENSWLKRLIFYPGSQQLRFLAVELLEFFLSSPSRRYYGDQFIGMLLQEVGHAGEYSAEFINIIKQETEGEIPFIFIACRGILSRVTLLITGEIEKLSELEASAINSSLAQGYALKYLTTILGNLLKRDDIRDKNRSSLIAPIFNGYLALRKLVMQRTKQVNEAEEKLLEIMESMTSGTEEETRSFMTICIEALRHCGMSDYRTPQFIYERLCTIIFPQEKEKTEFSLVIEKDPQQEDFLQGRMQGNPYPLPALASRGETAGGERDVIMRDIKNKVCRDCELVALLEDDTAMELLVSGKIISLDLPVKSVYKRIWLRDNPEGSPMRVMYRLRGLMGDATEEFIENLDSRSQNNADPEDVYRLASILNDGGGFPIVISHLTELSSNAVPDQAGPLIDVILKLFSYAINLKVNRQALISHAGDWKTFLTFITLLKTTIKSRPNLAFQLVAIMETAFKEASTTLSVDSYKEFVVHCGGRQDIMDLLDILDTFEADAKAAEHLLRIIPFLCYCNEAKMQIMVEHFVQCLELGNYDMDPSGVDSRLLEWLCRLIEQLGQDEVSATFKDLWLKDGLTKRLIDYFLSHGSIIISGLPESQDFKRCVGKNSMKYVLRLLTGLARSHEATQVFLSNDCVPSIHRLEHVSTPLSVLAENLMEAMKENSAVKERIEQIRDQTRVEKKRMAMAMRARQLGAMGMKANEKGEIVVTKPAVKGLEDLADDKGLHCCICREGYKFKPEKVLGVYTFTKRQPVEDLENKNLKTVGFNTVTHFTCVHIDCHMVAIKSTRDEWDKAALHNANTRCNGILPMWGPEVPESSFVQALARYNQHILDFTGVREVNYSLSVHDIKLSLLIFAEERSFSEVSRGGGRDSNIRLLPYTIHGALYVINSQRTVAKERSALQTWLKSRSTSWRAQCHMSDSPLYYAVLYLLMYDRKQWIQDRMSILQRLLVYSHEKRNIQSNEPQEYSVYKSSLVFFGLIDSLYAKVFVKVPSEEEDWPEALATFIRNGDIGLMESCETLLRAYEEEYLVATSAAEMLDLLHLLETTPDPHAFIVSALANTFPANTGPETV